MTWILYAAAALLISAIVTVMVGSLIRFGTELDDEDEWWR